MNNFFNPFVVLSKQQKKNTMKKIKTTAEQRQIGKKCNCFYKGKIYPCEVIGFKGKNVYSVCRIDELGMEVNIRSTLVNWTDDPQGEEIWLDDYEEKKDRTERLRETRTAMQQVVRDSISANRKEVDYHSKNKRRGTIDPKQLILLTPIHRGIYMRAKGEVMPGEECAERTATQWGGFGKSVQGGFGDRKDGFELLPIRRPDGQPISLEETHGAGIRTHRALQGARNTVRTSQAKFGSGLLQVSGLRDHRLSRKGVADRYGCPSAVQP